MCSNDKYFIIENFINDIECKHNNIKKTYILWTIHYGVGKQKQMIKGIN